MSMKYCVIQNSNKEILSSYCIETRKKKQTHFMDNQPSLQTKISKPICETFLISLSLNGV